MDSRRDFLSWRGPRRGMTLGCVGKQLEWWHKWAQVRSKIPPILRPKGHNTNETKIKKWLIPKDDLWWEYGK